MDFFTLAALSPWVLTHPWFLSIALPALFWLLAHIFANIPQPTEKSNTLWKAIYPVLNSVIAANYAHAKNLIPNVVPTSNAIITSITTVLATPTVPTIDTSNTVTTTSIKG